MDMVPGDHIQQDAKCVSGYWVDIDDLSADCNANGHEYINGGEDHSFGEYDTGNELECCGDDGLFTFERINEEKGINIHWTDGEHVCCDIPYDCVYNGNCYNISSVLVIAPVGAINDSIAFCSTSTQFWRDCDDYDHMDSYCGNYCGPKKGINYTGDPDPTWNAVASGEISAHGEYNSSEISSDNLECCGDDTNESYIYMQCGLGFESCTTNPDDDACCNYKGDCVYQGVCYSTGYGPDVDGDQDADYCHKVNWYDSDPYP
jgi:hypothetical protein